MTKRLIVAFLLLVLAIAAGSVAGCGGGLPSDAVAKVGDTLILKSDFDERVQEFATQYSVTPKEEDPEGWAQFEGDVLEYLIMYEMVAQKAVDLQVTVTEEELQTEIDTIVTTYYGGDQEAFNADLEQSNMTIDQLKANYRENMLMQRVYEKVTESVTEVPEDKIAAYFEENKAKYFEDETRATRHILIAPGTSPANTTTTTTAASASGDSATTSSTTTTSELTDADWTAALATAEQVLAKLKAGGDWTALAAEYSDDPSTADSGGELGNVSKGEMVPEFEESVFSLGVDEISEPIKTSYGYHIIQVTTINEAKQHTLDETEVKDDIKATLLNELKLEAWDKWVEETKADMEVVYQEGMEPTTTTTAAGTDTTSPPATTSGSGDTTATTAAPATTATTAGETIGTDTTAKP